MNNEVGKPNKGRKSNKGEFLSYFILSISSTRLRHQIAAVEKLGIEVPKPKGLERNKAEVLHRTFAMDIETLTETL